MSARPTDPALLIGVDFGGTKIEAAALERDGRELRRRRCPTPRGDYAASLAAIVDLVTGLESEIGRCGNVGIGIPGSLSRVGTVRNANSIWLNGRPFRNDMEAALARPVKVENDANCFALSEAADGAARGVDLAFGVILGTGCGGGLVHKGRLLGGRNGIAGEWGHNPLPWADAGETPGPLCWCGKRGCLEAWLSGPALAGDHRNRTGADLSPEAIVGAMRRGEFAATESFRRWRNRLARGLAHVADLVDPDVIVLGGGLSGVAEAYDGLTEDIARWVFSDCFDTLVLCNAHGDSSGVRGAARLWVDSETDRA